MNIRSTENMAYQLSLKAIKKTGLLLLTDAKWPSVATIVAGEPIKGSWWGHPKSHSIFRVATRLSERPDLLAVKLIFGKVTFVHRHFWPALLSVAQAKEPWQLRSLPPAARSLLKLITDRGTLASNDCLKSPLSTSPFRRTVFAQLQDRLLVYAEEFHTESGAHATRFESWKHWQTRQLIPRSLPHPEEAKKLLEEAAQRLSPDSRLKGALPWLD